MSTLKSSAENLTLNADGSGNDVIIQSNGSTLVTVDGSASGVGIGTTTPQNKVHIATGDSANDNYRTGADTPLIVEGTTSAYIQIVADANAPMGVVMADASDSAIGGIIYDADAYGMRIKSGGSTRLEVATAGDVTVNSGDIVFGTAGKGIVLGSTTNTDANTLDDYEEGTFTPALSGQTTAGNTTYALQKGFYEKIGRTVHIRGRLEVNSKGTIDGLVFVTGLPFTANITYQSSCIHLGYADHFSITASESISGNVTGGDTTFLLRVWGDTGGTVNMDDARLSDSSDFYFSGTYYV